MHNGSQQRKGDINKRRNEAASENREAMKSRMCICFSPLSALPIAQQSLSWEENWEMDTRPLQSGAEREGWLVDQLPQTLTYHSRKPEKVPEYWCLYIGRRAVV